METGGKMKGRLLLTGVAAGLVNGFFGGGGGMLLAPLLMGWIGLEDKRALATCVAAMLPMCAASSAVYFLRSGLALSEAAPYLLGGLAGGILSGLCFKKVPPKILVKLFAILIIYGGVRSLLR